MRFGMPHTWAWNIRFGNIQFVNLLAEYIRFGYSIGMSSLFLLLWTATAALAACLLCVAAGLAGFFARPAAGTQPPVPAANSAAPFPPGRARPVCPPAHGCRGSACGG